MTTARTAYTAGTPDRPTFFPAPEEDPRTRSAGGASYGRPRLGEDVQFDLQERGLVEKLKGRWNIFYDKARETWMNNTGMLFIAASQAFFALMNVAVKKLNSLDPPVSVMELVLVRMGITWSCCITYMYFAKIPDPFLGPPGVRILLAVRGFFGFFGLFGVYYSLQYLSISDATVITFLAPVFTTITGAVLLGESFSWRQAGAGLCSLFGVILIARPASLFGRAADITDAPLSDGTGNIVEDIPLAHQVTAEQRLAAVGVALLGVVGATGAYTTIRAIGTRAHPLHNIVAFSSQCVIVATVGMIVMHEEVVLPLQLDWIAMLLMIGFFGFFAQTLLTMGLQREAVGRGTMAVYVQVVFAMSFDQIFFHSSPALLSILGTLIIISSALYVAVMKEDTGAKKRLQSQAASVEDISLEEGLLANEEGSVDRDLAAKEAAPHVANGHGGRP